MYKITNRGKIKEVLNIYNGINPVLSGFPGVLCFAFPVLSGELSTPEQSVSIHP